MGNTFGSESSFTAQWRAHNAKPTRRPLAPRTSSRPTTPVTTTSTTTSTTTTSTTTTRNTDRTNFLTCKPLAANLSKPAYICFTMGNTLFSPTANVQTQLDAKIDAKLDSEIEAQINDAFNSSGFHIFKVGGNATLGLGILILFVISVLVILACCYYRCRKSAVKHFSVRNAMANLTSSFPAFGNPFASSHLPGSLPTTLPSSCLTRFPASFVQTQSMPILQTPAATYHNAPSYEMVPMAKQDVYHPPAANTPLLMPAPPNMTCLLYTSPSPRDKRQSRMPSSA